jgi:hypothetical protein
MPHAQATNPTSPSTVRIHSATSTGSIVGNDTTTDVWPIWVENNNATRNAIVAGVQRNINRAISTGEIASGIGVSNQVWTIWNETYASASTTIVTPTIVTPTITSNVIWDSWIVAYNNSVNNVITHGVVPHRQITEAERQARAEEDARWRERNAAFLAEEAKAKDRAEKLLQENLDAKQREELAAKGYFELDVISKNGSSRRYRIHRRWSGNIQQVDPSSGQRLKTLCIHPREVVPIADSMLAQKLMLESGMEEDLLRIANHS